MSAERAQLKRQILSLLLNNKKKAFRPKEIAKRLNIRTTARFSLFEDILEELAQGEMIDTAPKGRYTHRERTELRSAEGTLRMNLDGYGFVTVPAHGDYFIRANRLGTALDGDWVRINLAADVRGRSSSRHQEAEIVEVIDRKRQETVGDFEKMDGYGLVRPDDQRVHKNIHIPSGAFNKAKQGDKVRVVIDAYTDPRGMPQGRVLEVLGKSDDPNVAVLSIALSQGIAYDFPAEVEEEAAWVPTEVTKEIIDARLDLRKARVFTIDPEDAKDFDDAIHIERLPSGDFSVGVHIADVSHYVKQGSALDAEAYKRGTSTYLVDRTIPMLPEVLSNQACSLRPNEDKLAYSLLMVVSPRGVVKSYELKETVIRSIMRLTYEEAQQIMDGGISAHEVKDDVLLAAKLARTLTTRRGAQGVLAFDTPEIKVILDPEGHPIDIVRRPQLDSHRLVEEFMLLANRTVSEHIGAKKGAPPFVYRIHDQPDIERIKALREYVRAFGFTLPKAASGGVSREDLAALLAHFKDTPSEIIVSEAALRTMAKAAYSHVNIGHFGLGFKHYTHFTSPIRRYPDLIAHRLLKHYTSGGGQVSEEALAEACDHCSAMERRSVEAERESVRLKQVEYVAEHLGEVEDGIVKGVTKFGIFVEMTRYLTEGLVHVRDMGNDFYEFDQDSFTLTGRRTGHKIRLGDPVKVQIAAANVETRRVDLLLVDNNKK